MRIFRKLLSCPYLCPTPYYILEGSIIWGSAANRVDMASRFIVEGYLGCTIIYRTYLKSNFFRAKTFNIFYVFGRKKISTSSIRAPIKPRKFPIKPIENPQKHIEFSTSDVFHPLYWPKKRGESPGFGALSSSLVQRYNIFARNANRFNISQQPAKC